MSILSDLNVLLAAHTVDLDDMMYLGSLHNGYTCDADLFIELAKDSDEIAEDFIIIFSDLSYVSRSKGCWIYHEDIILPTNPTEITNLGKNGTPLWVSNTKTTAPVATKYGLTLEQSPLAFLAGFNRETK